MEPVRLFGCGDATTVGFLDVGACSYSGVCLLEVDCDGRVGGGSRIVR